MHSYNLHHIDAVIRMNDDFLWRFIGIYGHTEAPMKIHIWELLYRLHYSFSLLWMIRGDFNEILKQSEKLDGLPRNLEIMTNFQSVFRAYELLDIGFFGFPYTWNNQ